MFYRLNLSEFASTSPDISNQTDTSPRLGALSTDVSPRVDTRTDVDVDKNVSSGTSVHINKDVSSMASIHADRTANPENDTHLNADISLRSSVHIDTDVSLRAIASSRETNLSSISSFQVADGERVTSSPYLSRAISTDAGTSTG